MTRGEETAGEIQTTEPIGPFDRELWHQLEPFLRPLYQDLDGISRFDEVERIGRIARRLVDEPIAGADARALELLLLFHALGSWLEKVGNLSRALLTVRGLTEEELRRTAASIRRLEVPTTNIERIVASAIMIDAAGVRGLATRLARARREGTSVLEVAREELATGQAPDWMSKRATEWLASRRASRIRVCEELVRETTLES